MKQEPRTERTTRKFWLLNRIPESCIFEYCEKLLEELEERKNLAQKGTKEKSNTYTPPKSRKRPKTQYKKPQMK